jgi:fatty-acyl-CoA synthase
VTPRSTDPAGRGVEPATLYGADPAVAGRGAEPATLHGAERALAGRGGAERGPTWFGAHLVASAAEAGDRTALVFEDRRWTYAQLDQAIRRAAAHLHQHGVRRGDRVVMQGAARPEAFFALFAAARLGAAVVPLHPLTTRAELDAVRAEVTPRAVVAEDGWAGCPGLTWAQLTADPAAEWTSGPPPAGPDVAIIAYTSGTSGRPKGVALTHDNLHWSLVNGMAGLPVRADEVTLVATPLAHVAVLGGLPQYTWVRRGTVVLAPRFEAGLFLDLVREHRVTAAFAVPAMLALLTRHPRFAGPGLDSLRWVLAGGAPAVSATTARLLDRGVRVLNSYGLTEASAGVTYADPGEVGDWPTSAGRPVPHVELRVAGETGASLPDGEIGEIWLRGPSIAASYWTPDGPRPATDADGWFHTGDRGRYDDAGRVEVVGRARDTVITGGENVDPAEVENALAGLPGIVEVAVCGSPDPVWGEVVTAVVVAGAAQPSLDDLRRHLDGRLAKHKWPRLLRLVPALPRNATGKLQRQRLADLATDLRSTP